MRARAAYGAAAILIAMVLAVASPDREALAGAAPWCAALAVLPAVAAGGPAGAAGALAILVFGGAGAWYAANLGPLAAAAHALALGALVWAMMPAALLAKTKLQAAVLGLAGMVALVLAAERLLGAWTLDATLARSAAQSLYGGAAIAVALPLAARFSGGRPQRAAAAIALCTALGLVAAWFAAQRLGLIGWWAGFGLAAILLVFALLLVARDTVRNDEAHAHSAR